MTKESLPQNLARVRAQIEQACLKFNVEPPRLIAVSKRHPTEAIAEAYACGQRDFGENLAPEMSEKMFKLRHLQDIRWHFLGRIQSNKAKDIAHAHVVHGVDSIKHARALDRHASNHVSGGPLSIFLQVNVSDEDQKSGFKVEGLGEGLNVISELSNLKIEGLMGISKIGESDAAFALLSQLRGQHSTPSLPLKRLSMGMTADFSIAISHGATDIRIGTAIFGARSLS